MQQILWHIPIKTSWFPEGIPIYGFGMMLFVAFIVCTWMAGRRAEREGVAREHIQDMTIWLFLGGLLGARILYLLKEEHVETLKEFFVKLPQIWNGGIILYGAILGALAGYVGAWWFIFRKLGVSTLKMADIVAPATAVGICLGRIGCFLNGCCYGAPVCPNCPTVAVHFPWTAPAGEGLVHAGDQDLGFTFAPADRQLGKGAVVGKVEPHSAAARHHVKPGDVIIRAGDKDVKGPDDVREYLNSFREATSGRRGQTNLDFELTRPGELQDTDPFTPRTLGVYPTQLFESVSMFLLLLVLLAYYPFRRHDGQVMAVLMMGYGIHRWLNEQLRDDARPEGFEKYTSLILLAAGALLWLYLWRKPAQYPAQAPAPAVAPAKS